jgi:hypothetical protein
MPPLLQQQALAELVSVGALLFCQAENCNRSLLMRYEYLYKGRPISGITHAEGHLRDMNIDRIAALEHEDSIRSMLSPGHGAP